MRKSKREIESTVDRLGGGETFTIPEHWMEDLPPDAPRQVDRQAFMEEWIRRAAAGGDDDA